MADFVVTKIEKRFGQDAIAAEVLSIKSAQDLDLVVN